MKMNKKKKIKNEKLVEEIYKVSQCQCHIISVCEIIAFALCFVLLDALSRTWNDKSVNMTKRRKNAIVKNMTMTTTDRQEQKKNYSRLLLSVLFSRYLGYLNIADEKKKQKEWKSLTLYHTHTHARVRTSKEANFKRKREKWIHAYLFADLELTFCTTIKYQSIHTFKLCNLANLLCFCVFCFLSLSIGCCFFGECLCFVPHWIFFICSSLWQSNLFPNNNVIYYQKPIEARARTQRKYRKMKFQRRMKMKKKK